MEHLLKENKIYFSDQIKLIIDNALNKYSCYSVFLEERTNFVYILIYKN
ncbi:hypothetical protein SAMN05216498_1048 [Tenuibacillus multivorans]|uniref:Uncharacterized protein n=1 Tax=Tenuibacillus multivorans TaxID=237069 RepID=A0A1G9X7G1_9BACI|nr:hypothetical protein SAMN05216498_1048 [Tenuibacillus multivorans]